MTTAMHRAAAVALIDAAGLTARPHTKTHKCAAVAELQLLAGAVGVCCAKPGEAEALARAGIGPIHVTSPIVPALARRPGRRTWLFDMMAAAGTMYRHLASGLDAPTP